MNIIQLLIFICVVIIIIKFLYIFFAVYDTSVKVPIMGKDGILVSQTENNIYLKSLGFASSLTTSPFIGIIIIFFILYIIYLIILLIVPDTGIITFFIPLKELLLSIPPLPDLEKAGIFRLFTGIGKALALDTAFKRITGINTTLFIFTNEHIKNILRTIMPNLNYDNFNTGPDDDKSIASSNGSSNGSSDDDYEYKPKQQSMSKQKIYKKIEKEQEICKVNNYKQITPDMSKDEIMKTNFKNSGIDASCASKTTPKYILS